MAQTSRDLFINSLQNTKALEEKISQVLKHQINQADEFPKIKTKLKEHLEETDNHAKIIDECLKSLGSNASTVKEAAANFMGLMEGIMNYMDSDAVLANSIMAYATENFEIATYKSLIFQANTLEEFTVASKLQSILDEEIDMADWLDKNLEITVSEVSKLYSQS